MYFLVSCETYKVLSVGDVRVDATGARCGFVRKNTEYTQLARAIERFLAMYGSEGIRLFAEDVFWDLDLSAYERVDADFGLPFRGGRRFGLDVN